MFNKKKIEELKKEIKTQDNQFNELQKKYSKSEKDKFEYMEENKTLKENIDKYLQTIKEQRKKIRELKKELKVYEK